MYIFNKNCSQTDIKKTISFFLLDSCNYIGVSVFWYFHCGSQTKLTLLKKLKHENKSLKMVAYFWDINREKQNHTILLDFNNSIKHLCLGDTIQ